MVTFEGIMQCKATRCRASLLTTGDTRQNWHRQDTYVLEASCNIPCKRHYLNITVVTTGPDEYKAES